MVYAVYDSKAAQYGQLITLPTRGVALRSFADVVSRRDSQIAQYPADYALYELGEYDQSSGKLVAHSVPQFVVSAAAVVQQFREASGPTESVSQEGSK